MMINFQVRLCTDSVQAPVVRGDLIGWCRSFFLRRSEMRLLLLLLCLWCVGLDDALYRRPRIPCPAEVLNNGRVRFRQKSGFAQYQCFKGYLLAGEKYSRCVNGHWDSPRPKCVRASCQKIKPPANGLVHASHRGAVLNFFCRPGFELNGPNVTSCDGRVWDAYLPTCLPTHVTPSLSCDFETSDLCGWSHDLNHNFDWTRMNYRTPSGHVGTGPAHDHTKGRSGGGYYVYVESSSRNVNDTARLISPVYERQENDTCLEFYYHMYGVTMGELRVYVKKVGEPWVFARPEEAVFRKGGDQGNRWLRSWTRLGPVDGDFQVIFEGVRGTSYVSDIAVDDVRIVENCAADDEEDATTTTEWDAYTDADVAYGSCSNRCDNVTSSSDGCDCDDACADKNTCCPDYIAICVLGDFSTDYTDYFAATSATAQYESATAPPPTERVTEATTVTRTAATSMTTAKTPPPTKKQTRPITTTTTVKTSTTSTPTKTTEELRRTSVKLQLIDDIATLPSVTEEEEEIPIVMIASTEAYDGGYDSEKAATIKEKPKGGASVTVAIVAVCAVVVVVLLVAFIARKYARNSCLRMKKMKSGNGDSQSDVRFLTSDEFLDFRLATPDDDDDYNTL